MINSKLLYVIASFLVFLGILSLITGNPDKIQILNNPEAYKYYLLSWSIHGTITGVFFFSSYLMIRKAQNKGEKFLFFIHNKKQYKIIGLTLIIVGICLAFFVLSEIYTHTPDSEELVITLTGIGVGMIGIFPFFIIGIYFVIKGMTNKKDSI